jgi:hypothetical protein
MPSMAQWVEVRDIKLEDIISEGSFCKMTVAVSFSLAT